MKLLFQTIFTLIFFFFTGGNKSDAQTLKPSVIATSGGYSSSGGVSLSWTMGETFTQTLQSGTTILTQGFQQPVATTFYEDYDGDGYGNVHVSIQAAFAPVGYVTDYSDCNDSNLNIHPGAIEICNGIDDNCNGIIDEGAIPPATPNAVSGVVNVCPYINTGVPLTYSIAAVANAAGYQWTVPPTVTILSGQGTNSISVRIESGFAGSANKVIKVKATSTCGNSADKLLYLIAQFPTTAAPISGTTNICSIIGTANTATYSVPAVTGASSYIWVAQSGTTTITYPNGNGINGNSINVRFDAGFTSSAITVQAVNDCGTSGIRSLTVHNTIASMPGPISGPTNACPYVLPNGTPATYSVNAIAGATDYTWTAPAGAIITHPNGTGVNDNAITVQFPAGFVTGNITVSATNGCGTGGVRSLAIDKLNPSTPGVIDVIQTSFCPARVYNYSLASMPLNAASVQWTVPAGATLLSGQGTTSISVSYPSTGVTGAVTATATSNCATSVTRSSTVKLPACPPAAFARNSNNAGKKVKTNIEATDLEVNVMPNPSSAEFNLVINSSSKGPIEINITDANGRVIENKTLVDNVGIVLIGRSYLPGIYFAHFMQDGKKKVVKLIKL